MKLIPLTKGMSAIVDDDMYESLMRFKWHARTTWHGKAYASRRIYVPGGKSPYVHMHHVVLGVSGVEVDHINGDSLDNRRDNLRPCSHVENMRNRRKSAKATSRYKGVSWSRDRGKWQAHIEVGKSINLGRFDSEEDAARAYDAAARLYFGPFARVNFDDEPKEGGRG